MSCGQPQQQQLLLLLWTHPQSALMRHQWQRLLRLQLQQLLLLPGAVQQARLQLLVLTARAAALLLQSPQDQRAAVLDCCHC